MIITDSLDDTRKFEQFIKFKELRSLFEDFKSKMKFEDEDQSFLG